MKKTDLTTGPILGGLVRFSLPMIIINKNNPSQQKPTTASRQYKDFLQQYNNCIKTLAGILRKSQGEEESPLREFLRNANMER